MIQSGADKRRAREDSFCWLLSTAAYIAAEAESRQGKSEIVSALCSLDDEREISSLAVYRYGEHVWRFNTHYYCPSIVHVSVFIYGAPLADS